MADFLTLESRHGGQVIDRVFYAGSEADFVFGRGSPLFSRAPVELMGVTEARVVADGPAKWFEFGFKISTSLAGNGAAGYTDGGNYLRLELQWSPDLVNWSMGKFAPAPLPVVDAGGGSYEYWSRALHPPDAAVKTGALTFYNASSDSRNNGFTSCVIAGVVQALAHFPYDMAVAGTAAQLQADLRALGWSAATVTGSSAADWQIAIPSANYTSYAQASYFGFPGYLIADVFGVLNTTIDQIPATGSFVDASGVAIFPRAFARLKISPGSRYGS